MSAFDRGLPHRLELARPLQRTAGHCDLTDSEYSHQLKRRIKERDLGLASIKQVVLCEPASDGY